MPNTEIVAFGIDHANRIAGLGRSTIDDIARKDPWMPGAHTIYGFPVYAHDGHRQHRLNLSRPS
jgi:hypothetical protein